MVQLSRSARRSVEKAAQTKYVTPAINSKRKYEKLAFVAHVLQLITRTWSFYVAVLERAANKYTWIYNARAQPLRCSLNLMFGGDFVAFAVVVFLRCRPHQAGEM